MSPGQYVALCPHYFAVQRGDILSQETYCPGSVRRHIVPGDVLSRLATNGNFGQQMHEGLLWLLWLLLLLILSMLSFGGFLAECLPCYSYPQMQWLFDVKICIVEIHTSVIILWFFYLYFMKGTKLHWNICCYKRENVDVIWIRLDTTIQCRGINRKDCSQVTDFGNFGLKACSGGWGFWKKIESRRGLVSWQRVLPSYNSSTPALPFLQSSNKSSSL